MPTSFLAMIAPRRPGRFRRPGLRPWRVVPAVLLLAGACLLALPAVLPPAVARWTGGGAVAWGQAQLVDKAARVEVPVYEDNLDDAKSRGVHQGQLSALRSLIGEMVAAEWVTLFDKELRTRILARMDRFIASYRVQRSETSADRTRYHVALSVQINRAQLVEALHELSLPLKGDQPTPLALYVSREDPLLSQAPLRAAVEEALRERLTLLNFQPTGTVTLTAAAATPLADPSRPAAERHALLARERAATVLYLAFLPAPLPAADAGTGVKDGAPRNVGAKAVAWLYQRVSGRLLASFEQQEHTEPLVLPPISSKDRSQLLARLVAPLVAQMQPGAIQADSAAGNDAAALRLRVLGLRSVAQQEQFEQAFFKRNTPFERFALQAVGAEAVTYQGPYRGDRTALEKDLRGREVGAFKVRQVYWYNDVLELDVASGPEPPPQEIRLFPKEVRSPDVAAVIEHYLTQFNQLEVEDPLYAESEDNGWLPRANPLPLDASVYGFLDARSDSDFYVVDAVTSGAVYELVWHRLSRTNLSPAVRIYDAQGNPVATFTPRSWLRHEYTVPKGEHRFYVEIGDRFGYVRIDTGGYLNFHYLFKVRPRK